MSDNQKNDLDLSLHFLPDWAKQGQDKNIYDKYTGSEEVESKPRGKRRSGPDRNNNRSGAKRPSNRDGRQGPGGGRGKGGGPRRGDKRPGGAQRAPRKDFEPLPDLEVSFVADDAISNSLSEQIKLTARAYPLFSIANMILEKPERYNIRLAVSKEKGSDEPAQKLFSCALDDTLWLNESDAVNHLLKNHLGTFYDAVKTEAEPPKGTYTFVGQCGMSGVILGPPNYHDYQNQLRKLYNERFSKKMSFDRFKSRVKIVKDEETVNKWLEEQSFVTTYNVLNSPDSLTLNSWNEVIEHFNQNHRPNMVQEVSKFTVKGAAASEFACPQLRRLMRVRLQDQKRFPLKVVHLLSQQFSGKGLQFFKVNKSVTHVCVSRPHYLDLDNTSVKSGIKKIIAFITEHPGCNRKQLIDHLVGDYLDAVAEEESSQKNSPSSESPSESSTESDVKTEDSAPDTQTNSENSPAQKAIIGDLHWLLYQGNVIEFASGILEVAKKPERKPEPAKSKKAKQKQTDDSKSSTEDNSSDKASETNESASSPEKENEPAEINQSEDNTSQENQTPSQESITSPATSEESSNAQESSTDKSTSTVTESEQSKVSEPEAEPSQPEPETEDSPSSQEIEGGEQDSDSTQNNQS